MYRPGDDIKLDDLVFCLPGLVIGFNTSILPGIDSVRKAVGLEKISFYIETWKDDGNTPWVNAIIEQHKDYPNINLKIREWTHEDIDFPKQWDNIYRNLGINFEGPINVHMNLFKRLVPFIIYQKLYSRIHADITISTPAQDLTGYNNIPIFRIKPDFVFHEPEYVIKSFVPKLIKDLSSHFIQFTPIGFEHVKSPFDIFYTDHITSHSIDDIFYFASAGILYRTFGTTTEDTVEKFIQVTEKYLSRLPFKVKDPHTFGVICTNQEYYALEGSVLLKDFIDLNTKPVNYGRGVETRWSLQSNYYRIFNPRYYIKDGEVIKYEDFVLPSPIGFNYIIPKYNN